MSIEFEDHVEALRDAFYKEVSSAKEKLEDVVPDTFIGKVKAFFDKKTVAVAGASAAVGLIVGLVISAA